MFLCARDVRNASLDLGFKAEFEVSLLGDENRITDVLIEFDYLSRKFVGLDGFAVECQCAQISVDEYNERTMDYQKFGLRPLWIFGQYYYKFDRVRSIIKENISDFGFACFYVDKEFYIFHSD